jgi:hypothetical protein
MSSQHQRLELTWIGKENRSKLELGIQLHDSRHAPDSGRNARRRVLFDAQDEIDRRRGQFMADVRDKLQQRASLTALPSTRCRLA